LGNQKVAPQSETLLWCWDSFHLGLVVDCVFRAEVELDGCCSCDAWFLLCSWICCSRDTPHLPLAIPTFPTACELMHVAPRASSQDSSHLWSPGLQYVSTLQQVVCYQNTKTREKYKDCSLSCLGIWVTPFWDVTIFIPRARYLP
jgi:hypothetical protein